MEAKDRRERESNNTGICSLEWIAWAMDAARRHKDVERLGALLQDDERVPTEEN